MHKFRERHHSSQGIFTGIFTEYAWPDGSSSLRLSTPHTPHTLHVHPHPFDTHSTTTTSTTITHQTYLSWLKASSVLDKSHTHTHTHLLSLPQTWFKPSARGGLLVPGSTSTWQHTQQQTRPQQQQQQWQQHRRPWPPMRAPQGWWAAGPASLLRLQGPHQLLVCWASGRALRKG